MGERGGGGEEEEADIFLFVFVVRLSFLSNSSRQRSALSSSMASQICPYSLRERMRNFYSVRP